MGMYDNIRFEIECPNCKTKVSDFQSKDGACAMFTLEFWEVNRFYASCPKCNTWIEFTIKQRPNRRLTIKDYHMKVEVPSKKEQREHKKKYEELAKFLKSQKDKTPKQKTARIKCFKI